MVWRQKRNKKSAQQREDDRFLRNLVKIFTGRGVSVRQENLSRGHSFRVKSGACKVEGQDVIFLDRRLPSSQQATVLTDFLVDAHVALSDEELDLVPPTVRPLFETPPSDSGG